MKAPNDDTMNQQEQLCI